ncbi:MAG: hypothetical protein AAGI63_09060 [Planctomycetota bacterium]
MIRREFIVGVFVCILTIGCAQRRADLDSARHAFAAGDLVAAQQTLSELADNRGPQAIPAAMDLAIVELASGHPKAAEKRLIDLRNRFQEMPEWDGAKEAAALVVDDRVRAYRPAGYEDVMIRAMLSICSLAGDQIDAESYALQANMRQNKLAQQAENRGILDASDVFQPIAMAPYLRGMLREATHRDYDDAERAYQLVSSVRPQFAPASADLARVADGVHSAPEHGVLYVLACVGRGPVLHETVAPTTSQSLSIASAVLNREINTDEKKIGKREDEGIALPNIASVKIPQVVLPESDIAALGVVVEGTLRGATQTLTDVGELAITQLESEQPWTIARAVARRAIKETAVAKAGDSLGLQGPAGSVFHFAAASAWSGMEHADTRCWGLLPREVQVFRMELPKGTHTLNLLPLSYQGQPIASGHNQPREIEIVDGRNTYVIAIAPSDVVYAITR